MNKIIKIIFGILIILFVVILILWFIFQLPMKAEPNKLSNIPKEAIWKGGVDEGFWFQLVGVDSIRKIYRFKIYNEYRGELVIDASFKKDSTCLNEYPLNSNVIKKINLFEYDKIMMIDNCTLRMIKPAYGGIFWKLDKE